MDEFTFQKIIIFSAKLALLVIFVRGTKAKDEFLPSATERKSEWIDPYDMIGYESEFVDTQKKDGWIDPGEMNRPHTENIETSEDKVTQNKLRNEVKHCRKQLAAISDSHTKCLLDLSSPSRSSSEQTCDVPFFKKFIRSVLEKISSVGSPMELHFTEDEIQKLKNYISDKGNVQDISAILTGIINNAEQPEQKTIHSLLENVSFFVSHEFVFVAIIAVVSVTAFIVIEMRIGISWSRQILCLVILGFFMSIPWEWICLYRKEFVKKQSQVTTQVPQHCITGNLTAYESFTLWIKHSFTFSDDPCSKYQESLLVDPLWEVTPAQAVSITLTKFFVAPLEHIGDAAGKSFRALFKEIPVQWQPLVFLATVIFLFLMVILASGAQIWTPLLSINFDRGNQREIKQLEQKVNELLQQVVKQNHENHSLMDAMKQRMLPPITQQDEKKLKMPVQIEDNENSDTYVESVGSNR